MPQLDNLIVLPQIFWLIFVFTLFYFLITFYFLPILVKSIKSRKYFLEHNNKLNSVLLKQVFDKRKNLISILSKDFFTIKNLMFGQILSTKSSIKYEPFKKKYIKLVDLILFASINSVFYCNTNLLSSLKFYPLLLNKKKRKN